MSANPARGGHAGSGGPPSSDHPSTAEGDLAAPDDGPAAPDDDPTTDDGPPVLPAAAALHRRYPDGVAVCTTPGEFLAAMRRSRGELCVRLVAADLPTVVCFAGDGWVRWAARPGRPPDRQRLGEDAVREQLRRGRPVLVTRPEVRELLAGPGGRSVPAAPGTDRPTADAESDRASPTDAGGEPHDRPPGPDWRRLAGGDPR